MDWNLNRSPVESSSPPPLCGIPTDAAGGNFLEAINSTLNFLDKHFIDRDLQRTGNSIVMISAGTGIFRVKPTLQQITKQRMMDNGIGMDFISLSQPPLHTVPLFLVECNEYGMMDFYEVPHWMNITFVDCDVDPSASRKTSVSEEQKLKWRDVTDPDNLNNPRWTGLEGILTMDEEAGGKLVSDEGFLRYVPPDPNKCCNRKFDSQDIWRDVNEFQPLPFASIISGFAHASSVSEGHIRGMPSFLKKHMLHNAGDDFRNLQCSESDKRNSGHKHIMPWGYINFPVFGEETSSDQDENYESEHSNMVYGLPRLPIDKSAELYTAAESFVEERVGSFSDNKANNHSGDSAKAASFELPRRGSMGATGNNVHLFGSEAARAHVRRVDELMRSIASRSSALNRELMTTFDSEAISYAKGEDEGTAETGASEDKSEKRRRVGSIGEGAHVHRGVQGSAATRGEKEEAFGQDDQPALKSRKIHNSRMRLSPSPLEPASHSDGNNFSLTPSASGTMKSQMMKEKSPRNIFFAGNAQARSDSQEASHASRQRDYIRNYRKRYAINPFRKGEGKAFLETRTHNRRRWSHVFPAYSLGRQENAYTYFGLNKKSLTQPAILPMTTDFIPSAKDIKTYYEIQSGYSLSICAYDSLENLVTEMVCQRLSMEYQLVEGYDPDEYAKLSPDLKDKSSFMTSFRRNASQMHILSMGHRIHLLIFDGRGQGEIVVTRYLSKRGTNTLNTYDKYRFDVWSPHVKKFLTVTQKFCQYPEPEFACKPLIFEGFVTLLSIGNKADDLILGNQELDTDYPKFVDQDFFCKHNSTFTSNNLHTNV